MLLEHPPEQLCDPSPVMVFWNSEQKSRRNALSLGLGGLAPPKLISCCVQIRRLPRLRIGECIVISTLGSAGMATRGQGKVVERTPGREPLVIVWQQCIQWLVVPILQRRPRFPGVSRNLIGRPGGHLGSRLGLR